MDKPTRPDGPNASQPPWPEDSASEEGFGATGVFGTVKAPAPAAGLPASLAAEPGLQENRAADAARPQPAFGAKALEEPVVHKVVFGGGATDSSPELLDRIRRASAEKSPSAAKALPAESGGKGSGGFTELLRTLEFDLPSPAAAKGTPVPETRPPAQDSGFTSLLRTLSSPEATPPPQEPTRTGQPAFGAVSTSPVSPSSHQEPRNVPAVSTPGGFTELLRAAPVGDPVLSGSPMYRAEPAEAPSAGGTDSVIPALTENRPGAFTQLFSSLGSAETSQPAPPPSQRDTPDSSRGSVGSFTQMLSIEPPSAPAELPRYEENKPTAGSVNYGHTPEPSRSPAPSSDPFSPPPLSEAQPTPSTPQGGSVGITRLIQMLDEPSKAPAPRREEAPVPPPQGAEPGVWTQTFASLAKSSDPPAQPPKTPEWAPPQASPAASGFPAPREAYPPASLREPSVKAPASASAMPGPSEFTRILDASRIRELAMRGGQAPVDENLIPPPPQQGFAAAPPPSIPNYPAPAPPPAVGMQGPGGVPHPGGYPPPAHPMNYGPQAGAMHAPGGSVPQHPGMYAPPMPPAPQPPPLKPVQPGGQPGMGKMQQYVPLLLVLIAVLLVVLIVTVIFLMKH